MRIAICSTCGTAVEWPEKICPCCGRPLKKFRNMVECRTCGELVDKNANKCPHCGARDPNKEIFIGKIVLLVAVFIFILPIYISILRGGDSDEAKTTQTDQSSAESAQSEAPEYIEISATALWAAYKENEVNADLLYGDKLLAVSGTVVDIGRDLITEAPCVSLDSGSDYGLYPIQCFFPKNGDETELIAKLRNGDSVTIYGKCTGEFVTHVQLSKCALAP